MHKVIPKDKLLQQYRRRQRIARSIHTVLERIATVMVLSSVVVMWLTCWLVVLDYMGIF